MGKRKKSINKEEICEDYCFKCKDGGSLRICDYKDCLKAYHPKCEEKDDSFLESEVPWTCSWHYCFNCNKTPKFHCLCCPISICGRCLCDFKFSVINKREGFCSHCATLVGLLEESMDPDSLQEKVDFNNKDTYEFYFKGYWDNVVKKTKSLTSVHVNSAIKQMKTDKIAKDFANLSGSEDSSEAEDEYEPRSSNDHLNKRKRNKESSSFARRKGKFKEKEFDGWASRILVDFLKSTGKDATEKLSQHDVNAIVLQYCGENKLFDPVKKKRVLCDEALKSLLGRKCVLKNSIYNLLAPHFAENIDRELSEIEKEYDSELKNETALKSCKRQRNSSLKIEPQKKEVNNPQLGCFASMVAQNVKCVYLNRSLVEELLKQPENFDEKVTGSFVRIKSDPYDYMQKNSHMLVKVTGVKRVAGNDNLTKNVLLQVSNMPKDITISQLSNDSFSEEECEDLRQRVKDGRLGRTSIVAFEEKARNLHEIITKQWIAKELLRLPKLIEQANEKGWRRQLHEYMERKQLLEKPSEQARLLEEFPEIIAEVEQTDHQNSKKDDEEDAHFSSEFSKLESTKEMGVDGIFPCKNHAEDSIECEQKYRGTKSEGLKQHENDNHAVFHEDEINEAVIKEENENHLEEAQTNSVPAERSGTGLELIEISDDDDEEEEQIIEISDGGEGQDGNITGGGNKTEGDSSSCYSWYCMSKHGNKAGPYSMSLLRQWSETVPRELGFKVWKANQSSNEAVPLIEAVRRFYNTSLQA